MNWLQFSMWITGIYTLYYLVMILTDILHRHRPADRSLDPELTFEEPIQVQQVPLAEEVQVATPAAPPADDTNLEPQVPAEPESVGTGGVPYQSIFPLARAEAIEYVGKVAF